MKQKIFMYLFVFAILIVLFQYVNSKNTFESYESKVTNLNERVLKLEDSINSLIDENLDFKYFTIDGQEEALTYFENKGYETSELIPMIKDQLYQLNAYKGDEHPLVPYASMTGNKMLINKVSIVNHRWILTDFTDGKHWGELFLNYEITDTGELKFNVVDYLMYPF